MHALHPCFLQDLCVWDLVLPLDFNSFLKQEIVKSLCMTLVYCPGLTCIHESWQYHSLVDFQLGVKLDSISPPDICTNATLVFAIPPVTSSSMCTALERVIPR